MTPQTITTLPALGQPLEGGVFACLITTPDGAHHAVALLPDQGSDLNWKQAKAWAEALGGQLPSRPVAALLFANVRDQLRPEWHWTSDELDASYAWRCYFGHGGQHDNRKSFEGSAVAVRLIPISA